MSYSAHSLGLDLSKAGASFVTGVRPTSVPMVDVGVDPALVIAFRSFITAIRDAAPAAQRASLAWGVSYLNALRPNQFGRFDPAKVSQAMKAIPADARARLDEMISPAWSRATIVGPAAPLNRYTISKLLADIDAGKFAGRPAPANISLTAAGSKTPLPGGGVLSQSTNKDPAPPPVQVGVKEVVCTDGYVRDAAGLCQPGAAPPVREEKPATVEEPKKDEGAFVAPTPEVEWTDAPPAVPSEIVEQVTPKKGPLGIAWHWWALGAVSVVGAGLWMSSSSGKKVTPNRRRSRSRSR